MCSNILSLLIWSGKPFNSGEIGEILELAKETRNLEPDDYINTVFGGVYDNVEMLDTIISDNAIGWKINRISKVSLCILRLAIYEIKFMDDIPVSVSINEAVELAKKYATQEDANFINGILSTVVKA